MKVKMDVKDLGWWFWVVTLVAFVAGFAGYREGFYLAIGVSAFQILYFAVRRGLFAFITQVRMVYFIFTLIGLLDPTLLWFGLMAVSTMMVIVFDRCVIARVLVHAPWNKGVRLS